MTNPKSNSGRPAARSHGRGKSTAKKPRRRPSSSSPRSAISRPGLGPVAREELRIALRCLTADFHERLINNLLLVSERVADRPAGRLEVSLADCLAELRLALYPLQLTPAFFCEIVLRLGGTTDPASILQVAKRLRNILLTLTAKPPRAPSSKSSSWRSLRLGGSTQKGGN